MSDPNEKYRGEFKVGSYRMTEEQFISLRRAEDGLEPFIPDANKVADEQRKVDADKNPLASDL